MSAQVPHVGKSMVRTPLRRVSKKRARENRLRAQLFGERLAIGAVCEAQFPECGGRAIDLHEVKSRGRRGSIVDPANVVFLCRSCRDFITGDRSDDGWSARHGWSASSQVTVDALDDLWVTRRSFRCPLSCTEDHRL